MRRILGPIVALALGLAAGGANAQAAARIAQGRLAGALADGVASFKDIPYAAPPVGDLRWRPPAAPAHWTEERKADAFGPACMQPTRRPASVSEDCLTLNIWTPADRPAGERLPVMVWIHGGAFTFGTGGTDFYDGSRFARRGVVVVTINYRLGRFGFFAHPALTAENPKGPLGDYGFLDQIAALKWVKANIAAFGGDPHRVTIAGESAGAMSVNYLLVSPLARGLFAGAISESGFARSPGKPMRGSPDSAEAVGTRIAQRLGVSGDGPAAAAALRALPAAALNTPPTGLLDPDIAFPIIDGVIEPQNVADAFAAGREVRVPIIEGGNSWEAALFADIARNPGPWLDRAGPDKPKVIALYAPAGPAAVAMAAFTDSEVTEPARFLAQRMTAAGEPAFVYFFSYMPAGDKPDQPGAPHGGEIGYVFGNLPDKPGAGYYGWPYPAATPVDRKLSDQIQAYWVAFIKTGAPDTAGGPSWPRWTAATETFMQFGQDGPVPRPAFEKAKLDFFQSRASAPLK